MNIEVCVKLLLISLVFAVRTALAASPSVWKADGYGNWSDETRWEGGNVPQAGWQVRSQPGAAMYATDKDAELLGSIKEIVLEGDNSALIVTNDSALSLAFKIWGEGRFEKAGGGMLTFDIGNDSSRIYCAGGCRVREGILQFASSEGRVHDLRGPLVVDAGGEIALNPLNNTATAGISGAGTISCDSNTAQLELNISNAVPAGTYVFSGKLDGACIQINLRGGEQSLTCTANSNVNQGRLRGGRLGVASFGGANNTPSSWGTKELVFVGTEGSDVPALVEYLGDGAETYRPIYVNEQSRHVGIGGGPGGGLVLKGAMTFTVGRMTTLDLFGDHAAACVFDCNMNVPEGYAVYTRKTGTGTWRFAANTGRDKRQNRGVVAVERGIVEYETIAEAGVECSLGDASMLHEPYAGEPDARRTVPYACIVGDGSPVADAATATMRYIGESTACVTTRPVSVSGAARFESSTADLLWSGFSGNGTLIFGGAAGNCFAQDIGEGDGMIAIGKEGPGTWTLGGGLDFSGGVRVDEGTLRLQTADEFSWFRLTVKKLYGDSSQEVMLSKISLYSADGDDLAAGLVYAPDCDADYRSLEPGEVCLGSDGQSVDTDNPIDNMFKPYRINNNGRWGRSPRVAFDSGDRDTWASIVMRLPSGAGRVVRYDMISGWYADNAPFASTPSDWVLEGSTDGVVWHQVEAVAHVGHDVSRSGGNYWISDASQASDSTAGGFPVSGSRAVTAGLTSLPSVAVAAGSVLSADAPVAVGSIVYDQAKGAGVLEGMAFAPAGSLSLSMEGAMAETVLPYEFRCCTGMENLSGWTVVCNGRVRSGWRLRAGVQGITVVPAGLTVYIR